MQRATGPGDTATAWKRATGLGGAATAWERTTRLGDTATAWKQATRLGDPPTTMQRATRPAGGPRPGELAAVRGQQHVRAVQPGTQLGGHRDVPQSAEQRPRRVRVRRRGEQHLGLALRLDDRPALRAPGQVPPGAIPGEGRQRLIDVRGDRLASEVDVGQRHDAPPSAGAGSGPASRGCGLSWAAPSPPRGAR